MIIETFAKSQTSIYYSLRNKDLH